MSYVEGFIVPVPAGNQEEYRRQAAEAEPLFKEFGAARMVEAWGDDVPEGKVTDFRMAVQAKEDENVVFSWFEYPSKEARDAANEKMRADPRMKAFGDNMPFDGKRMIMGGFAPFLDQGEGGSMAYVDGFILPVAEDKRDAYRGMAETAAPVFRDHGATRVVEAFADDVPHGEVTDFYRAVKGEEGEIVVFSWIEWPSKEARVAGWEKVMADERLKQGPEGSPFDGKRMFWGGFRPIVDA